MFTGDFGPVSVAMRSAFLPDIEPVTLSSAPVHPANSVLLSFQLPNNFVDNLPSVVSEARVRRLFVRMRLGEALAHYVQGVGFPLAALLRVDFLTARGRVVSPIGEVPLGRDPVVIEGPVVVLQQRNRHLGTVAGTDDSLVGFLGQSPRRVAAVDARPSAFVGVDERLAVVDDTNAVDVFEVVGRVLGCSNDVLGAVALVGVGLDREVLVYLFDPRYSRLAVLTAGPCGLFGQQID